MIEKVIVFVYGTLKRGEPNHHVMVETDGFQRFISSGTTIEKYPLVVGTKYNIPFLLNQEGQGNNIEGELYEVDETKLKILDELEAYPKLYDRKLVEIKCSSDGVIIKGYLYLLKNWRPDLLATSSNFLSNYSSLGDHGRPYVDRYVRAKDMDTNGSTLYFEIQGVKN